MREYFFHLETEDGVERSDVGIPCEDLEHAFSNACAAIPELAAERLRNRKNPLDCAFLIENADGELLRTVPFAELIEAVPARQRKTDAV